MKLRLTTMLVGFALASACGDDDLGSGGAAGATTTADAASTTTTISSSSSGSGGAGGITVEAALSDRMQLAADQGFSGVVIVASGGRVLHSGAYGTCVREENTACTLDTVFDVGSLTKQFTAAAIMALVDAGTISIDDQLSTFFPAAPDDKAAITIHELLTHTAGLPDILGDDYEPIDREAFLDLVFATPLESAPGSTHAYSNVGYSILGAIVEVVTAAPYEEALDTLLFSPSALDHTGYVLPDWSSAVVAHGYDGATAFGSPLDQPWDTDGPYWHLRANGGILSTAPDMLAWHGALLGTGVLSEAAKTAMFTPHVAERPGGDTFYGYGWVIEETTRGKLVWHNGGNDYFFADFWRYLDADVTVFCASNAYSDYAGNDFLASALAAIVFGAD